MLIVGIFQADNREPLGPGVIVNLAMVYRLACKQVSACAHRMAHTSDDGSYENRWKIYSVPCCFVAGGYR